MVSLVLNLTLLWKWILAIGIFDVLLNNAIVYYSTTADQIQHISLLDSKKDLVPSSQYFDSMCLHFFGGQPKNFVEMFVLHVQYYRTFFTSSREK